MMNMDGLCLLLIIVEITAKAARYACILNLYCFMSAQLSIFL